MSILSKEIQEFIYELKQLDELGCLRVPKQDLEKLVTLLNQAPLIVGDTPKPGRVTYRILTPDEPVQLPPKPGFFVVSEEDYSAHPEWVQKIREHASWFLRVSD